MEGNDEAVQRMIERHEFLRFEHRFGQVRARCYCGTPGGLYVDEGNARTDHKRHQDKMLAPTAAKIPKGGMNR